MAPTENKTCSESSESDSEMTLDNRNILASKSKPAYSNRDCKTREFGPLVLVFVGLPARGKTVLAHKLSRYLKWTGVPSEVFSVCDYCRRHIQSYNHNMFRADNREAVEMRQRSTLEAMEDATQWLKGDGQVAILDGTNPNRNYRQLLHEYFAKQLGFKVLFIESICDDDKILERNIKEIVQFNIDYKKMKKEVAMNDLRCKIEHFKAQYEGLSRRHEGHLSYIQVINAGEDLTAHKVVGPLQSKVLYYVSNFRPMAKNLYFSRHGESEYNLLGRIGGDALLSVRGSQYANCLARHFNEASISGLRVWTSQKRRTKQTAQGIEAPSEAIHALDELDAGVCEGLTYEEMQETRPQEFAWRDQDKLHYRYPWGESYSDIMARLEPVLMQLESEDNVLVISHQAVLRCVLGYFLDKEPDELPYIDVPLHTIIQLTSEGYNFKMELIPVGVECVNTNRHQPKFWPGKILELAELSKNGSFNTTHLRDVSGNRSSIDALKTVPSHYDNIKFLRQQNLAT